MVKYVVRPEVRSDPPEGHTLARLDGAMQNGRQSVTLTTSYDQSKPACMLFYLKHMHSVRYTTPLAGVTSEWRLTTAVEKNVVKIVKCCVVIMIILQHNLSSASQVALSETGLSLTLRFLVLLNASSAETRQRVHAKF